MDYGRQEIVRPVDEIIPLSLGTVGEHLAGCGLQFRSVFCLK